MPWTGRFRSAVHRRPSVAGRGALLCNNKTLQGFSWQLHSTSPRLAASSMALGRVTAMGDAAERLSDVKCFVDLTLFFAGICPI